MQLRAIKERTLFLHYVNHWVYNIYETCLIETALEDDAAPGTPADAFRKRRRRNDILKGLVIFMLQLVGTLFV